jgi:hypothetical protein
MTVEIHGPTTARLPHRPVYWGRAYLALARRDHIVIADFANAVQRRPAEELERVFEVSLCLLLIAAPKRRFIPFLRYLHAAWRRGRDNRIPEDAPREELLLLSVGEVRRRFGILPTRAAHSEGAWRVWENGTWAPAAS